MRKKSRIQKISSFFAIVSFIMAFGCLGWWLLLLAGDSASQVYKGSIGASAFFCFSTGIVLIAMARANLPSFKVDP